MPTYKDPLDEPAQKGEIWHRLGPKGESVGTITFDGEKWVEGSTDKADTEHKEGRRSKVRTREEFWAEWGADPFADYSDAYDKKMKAQFMADLDAVIEREVEDAIDRHDEARKRRETTGW
jgi:hypothetical protein